MKQPFQYTTIILVFVFFSLMSVLAQDGKNTRMHATVKSPALHDDFQFGISRKELLRKQPSTQQQNMMYEKWLDTNVVEVEGRTYIGSHRFVTYYYFDPQDSLYRIKAELLTTDKEEYEKACKEIAEMLYIHYGAPKKRKTIPGSYKFSWDFKDKQVMMEFGCFIDNCLLEITVTELRLLVKNRIIRSFTTSIIN